LASALKTSSSERGHSTCRSILSVESLFVGPSKNVQYRSFRRDLKCNVQKWKVVSKELYPRLRKVVNLNHVFYLSSENYQCKSAMSLQIWFFFHLFHVGKFIQIAESLRNKCKIRNYISSKTRDRFKING